MVPIFRPCRWAKATEVRQPRHGAVVVHDLADHARRVEARPAARCRPRLGMAGADQHAAVPRHQREDMAGRDDVVAALGRIDADGDGVGAVVGRDAGGDALARLDRDREGGAGPDWLSLAIGGRRSWRAARR